MKRRLPPILMTLVLVCALPIWAAFVTSGDVTNPLLTTAGASEPLKLEEVSTADDLQSNIDAGKSVKLTKNIDINTALNVTSTLTLDLNGCTLRMTGNTSVFYVYNNATLTIQDSSAAKSGTITGGNAGDGGVYIGDNSSEGHLVMTGGTITGCATDPSRGGGRGGGVFVFEGSFTMSGTAKITNCTAVWGGGVVVHTGSSKFTMNGGEISDCKASNTGGGVCLIGGAGFEMTGGIIRDCTAGSVESSAINIQPGTMKAHGGTVKGNVCVSGVGNCVITHEPSQEGYTIFDGTITFEGNGSTTAMYPVKFELDGGSADGLPETVRLGTALSKPAAPTKSGYTFTGWEDANGAYDFNTPVTGPLTLTAKWEKVPSSGGYYYYPTTDTKADDAKGSPKTADPGVALYAALSLLSLTGLTCTTKKR